MLGNLWWPRGEKKVEFGAASMRMDRFATAMVIALGALVAGGLSLGYAIHEYRIAAVLAERGVETNATVARMVKRSSGGRYSRSTYQVPQVDFADRRGKVWRHDLPRYSRYAVGDTVTVIYDPEAPTTRDIQEDRRYSSGSAYTLGVVGVLLLAGAGAAVYVMIGESRRLEARHRAKLSNTMKGQDDGNAESRGGADRRNQLRHGNGIRARPGRGQG